ncbi:MAG TPA: DUF2637 domain-containing protein [Candidatus Limnocylindrales bacterium]|nr:DUF2637 domain-containing protein [Candidatus Limnocylindrales bacterium]
MSRVDTAIKAAAGVTVVGLAGIAGAISYSHMTELAHLHGETGWRAHMFPLSVDGIEIVASLVLLADKRAGRRSGRLPWAALVAGTGASFAANMAVGGSDWIGRAVSGWPAFALLVAVKLLFGLLEHQAHGAQEERATVPDGTGRIALGRSILRTDELTVRGEGTNAPNGRTAGQDTVPERSVQRTTRPARKPRTGTVDERSGERTDRAALEAAARAVEAALADEGMPLTRDALAARLRGAGHSVSNSRASDLVRLLRANQLAVSGAAPIDAGDGA